MKINDLPKVGVYFGKFLPPHRGHLTTILKSATKCQKLYVIISDNKIATERICNEAGIKTIEVAKRLQWLSQEVLDIDHIKVDVLDETNLPEYPNGWNKWTTELQKVVGEHIDIFFCGEQEYADNLPKYFEGAEVELIDPERTFFNISATKIRSNPIKYWDYILGAARPFFAKSVLIAGTESCGKTTLTKSLAKIYHTSWSEEVGRYYAAKFLGGDERFFTDEDFSRIAHLQVEQDYDALRNANRVCFFDTDATATQYFSNLYMGHDNNIVEQYINADKYDAVFLLSPDVEWVDDGMRLNGGEEQRLKLHERLKSLYIKHGFNVIDVSGTYEERLAFVIDYVQNKLLTI